MKKHSDAEIIAFAEELWKNDRYPGSSALSDLTIKVKQYEGRVELTVHQMYEAPGLKLEYLKKLAEFFGTENINDDNRYSRGGCETCDYGSEYGFTLTIRA